MPAAQTAARTDRTRATTRARGRTSHADRAAASAHLSGAPAHQIGLVLALIWLAVVTAFAVFAPVLGFLAEPTRSSLNVNQGPGWDAWFGTDELGRDMFSRVIWGSRPSLLIALCSTAFGTVVGGLAGLASGYFRGWVDDIISGAVNIMLSLPALIFALLIVTVLEQNLRNVIIAVSLLSTPAVARVVRAQTLRVSAHNYIEVARSMGARRRRIIFREILPNILSTVLSLSFIAFGIVIVAEGALSFIGKSIPAPAITWGGLLASGKGKLEDASHLTIFPALIIFLTLLSVNYVGNVLLNRARHD